MSDQLVAELMQALDGIQKTFGSTASLDDREGRMLIAKQLLYAGFSKGGVTVLVEQEPTEVRFVSISRCGDHDNIAIDDQGFLWRLETWKDSAPEWARIPHPARPKTVPDNNPGIASP